MPTAILTLPAAGSSKPSIAALLTLVQVAPVFVLQKIPPPLCAKRRESFAGSLASANENPAGRPLAAAPESRSQVAPGFVVRQMPPLLAASAMVAPRGATPQM